MGGLSLWHWLIIIAVLVVLFGGRGRLSGVMGDLAKGIKAFRSGMRDEEEHPPVPPPQVPPPGVQNSPQGDRTTINHG